MTAVGQAQPEPNADTATGPFEAFGTRTGHKSGNKSGGPLKRTKVAESVTSPRDMGALWHNGGRCLWWGHPVNRYRPLSPLLMLPCRAPVVVAARACRATDKGLPSAPAPSPAGAGDYSAAIVGSCLQACEIHIWTDVPGVLTADPRVVGQDKALPIRTMTYEEALEFTHFGAKVRGHRRGCAAPPRGSPCASLRCPPPPPPVQRWLSATTRRLPGITERLQVVERLEQANPASTVPCSNLRIRTFHSTGAGMGPLEPVSQTPLPLRLGSKGWAHQAHRRTSELAQKRDLTLGKSVPPLFSFFKNLFQKSCLN